VRKWGKGRGWRGLGVERGRERVGEGRSGECERKLMGLIDRFCRGGSGVGVTVD
jgi:hypothetical protein